MPFTFYKHCSIIIIPIRRSPLIASRPILPNRNLDPLRCEALTQIRTLNNTREFLGAENMEDVAETGCKDGCRSGVEFMFGLGAADVHEVHLQSVRRRRLACGGLWNGKRNVPEGSFSSDAEILEDKPDTHPIFTVCQLERADAETTNQVPREHAARMGTRITRDGR